MWFIFSGKLSASPSLSPISGSYRITCVSVYLIMYVYLSNMLELRQCKKKQPTHFKPVKDSLLKDKFNKSSRTCHLNQQYLHFTPVVSKNRQIVLREHTGKCFRSQNMGALNMEELRLYCRRIFFLFVLVLPPSTVTFAIISIYFAIFFSSSTSVCSCIRQHTLCERQFFSPVACHNKIGKSNQRYSLVFLCFPATVCRSLFGGFVVQPHKFAMNFP